MNQFWENKHITNSDYYLTGSQGSEQATVLKVTNIIKPSDNILNIGVGKGYCTQYWVDYGCKVSVLDISIKAIEKVKGIIKDYYLDETIQNLPKNSFDNIVSLLVIQHMSIDTLKNHMKYVINSLKPNGIFAFQFAYSLNNKINDEQEITYQEGQSTRTFDEMKKIVEDNNGVVKNSFDGGIYTYANIGWYIFHVSKTIKGTN